MTVDETETWLHRRRGGSLDPGTHEAAPIFLFR